MSGYLLTFLTEFLTSKKQHNLTFLQIALDDTSSSLRIHNPAPALLHIEVALTIRLEDKNDLTTVLHTFVLSHNTAVVRKELLTCGVN